MLHNQKTTYRLSNNVFVPHCTGVIIEKNKIGDAYANSLDPKIQEAIRNESFLSMDYFIDDFNQLGLYSYDYRFLPDGKHTVFRFFNIECEKNMYAVFAVSSGTPMKLWINYELYSIFGSNKRICIVALKKGVNSVILETYKVTSNSTAFLRVSDYDVEMNPERHDSLFVANMYPICNYGCIKHSGNHLYNSDGAFEFAFYPEDDMHLNKNEAEIIISDIFSNKEYYRGLFRIKTKQRIDLSMIELPNEDDGNTLCARIRYEYSDGKEYDNMIPLYTKNTEERLRRLSNKTSELIKNDSLTKFDILALIQGYDYINKYGRTLSAILAQASSLRKNIEYIQSGKHLDDSIYSSGEKRIFFFNQLYNAVNYYWMYVPADYSHTKKYPLVVIFSTLEYNDRSKFFGEYTDEDVLVVDISMRGMTLGSYIGEAAIQCALDDILKKYSVDKERIYCTGTSNGAGGTWAQLEMFPDRYAAGYPVSGNANLTYLCNLKNVGLILLASNADYLNNVAFEMPMQQLKDNNMCLSVVAKDLTHQLLEFVWFKKRLFEKLLSFRRNPFPSNIEYRTMSNRHTKAYWIEIHSIEYGEIEGKIKAEIRGNSIIVSCEGITGFTIDTPPQLKWKSFSVEINGNSPVFFDASDNSLLHFAKKQQDDYCYMDSIDVKRDIRKGFGLLDVFLDPLSVVKPVKESNIESNTATAYSEPCCNGIIPKVYVRYPIIDYNEFEKLADRSQRSYIVLDNGDDNLFLKQIREVAAIKCDKNGWAYRSEEHIGNYCVQQIVKNPWNPLRSIHLISYNSEAMLSKNIFTRKLVLPSYVNGRHKYLNNMALIYDANGYSGIVDISCDVEKL